MDGQIKVTEHKHIIALRPVICSDCKGADTDYFKIKTEEDNKEKIVCEKCLLWSGRYERKEWVFQDRYSRGRQ